MIDDKAAQNFLLTLRTHSLQKIHKIVAAER